MNPILAVCVKISKVFHNNYKMKAINYKKINYTRLTLIYVSKSKQFDKCNFMI